MWRGPDWDGGGCGRWYSAADGPAAIGWPGRLCHREVDRCRTQSESGVEKCVGREGWTTAISLTNCVLQC